MQMSDKREIAAPPETVWAAILDPDVLKAAVPGCTEMAGNAEEGFAATVVQKVGPVKAKFGGDVTLDTAGAPDQFSLSGQGSGGTAGHAKGSADVTLVEDGDNTILRYEAKAEIGGKLAQLGSRLIQSTAKKLAGKFFKSFAKVVNEDVAA